MVFCSCPFCIFPNGCRLIMELFQLKNIQQSFYRRMEKKPFTFYLIKLFLFRKIFPGKLL